MTAEERERVQRLCTLIQDEKDHSKLTDLLQQLFALLESNGRGRSADGEKKSQSI